SWRFSASSPPATPTGPSPPPSSSARTPSRDTSPPSSPSSASPPAPKPPPTPTATAWSDPLRLFPAVRKEDGPRAAGDEPFPSEGAPRAPREETCPRTDPASTAPAPARRPPRRGCLQDAQDHLRQGQDRRLREPLQRPQPPRPLRRDRHRRLRRCLHPPPHRVRLRLRRRLRPRGAVS